MIKAAIFDLDGTLSDTITTIAYYGNSALQNHGFAEIPTEVYKKLVGNGKDILIHRMLDYYGADTEENFAKVCKDYDIGYEKAPLYLTAPYDGTPEAVKTLIENGIKCAVLSNKPDNVTTPIVEELFGKGHFEVCHGARDGVPIKPAPDGAVLTAKEMGFDVTECVFVGDTYVDIQTGKSAGMKTIGVLWGFRDYEELKNAGADFIISHPSEIFDIISSLNKQED